MNRKRLRYTGLTLVEVLLSMAIMAMVVAALAQMQSGGAKAALNATLVAEASVLCQSEMDAWLSGSVKPGSIDGIQPIAGTNHWSRRYTYQPVSATSKKLGLHLLTVEIYRGNQRLPAFTLSRWVPARGQEGRP